MRKIVWAAVAILLAGGTIRAQQYLISTVAGGAVTPTPASALSVQLARPWSAAVDLLGSVYFSDGNVVYKVDGSGILTRVAGNGIAGFSGDGGPATLARLKLPLGVAVDTSGSVYIADSGNSRVRKVAPDGTITTIAGNGTYGYTGDGGPATSAQLKTPMSVSVDAIGDVYIADSDSVALRKVTPDGKIATAVSGVGWGGVLDGVGNFYEAVPWESQVYKVAPDGTFTTVAGSDKGSGFSGDGGPATSAQLNAPSGVALDASGNLYIADAGNFRVRKVAVGGTITTVAGNGTSGSSGDGGAAKSGQVDPQNVAVDAAGNLFIVDMNNRRVRKVAADGTITTLAGGTVTSGDGGPATAAQLAGPLGLAADASGNFYFADSGNNRIRKVAADGTISTVAGTGVPGNSGDGGLATAAQLNAPRGVVLDSSGILYIADTGNHEVRKVAGDGTITTVASMPAPDGVAVDAAGNLYMADTTNYAVRKRRADGTVTTVAQGNVASDGSINLVPMGVAVDATGNVFIADDGPYWVIVRPGSSLNHTQWNSRIREVAPGGAITTAAGNGLSGYSGDGGPATEASLAFPNAVAVDAAGNLFIGEGDFDADSTGLTVSSNQTAGNERIRKVDASGTITTVAGDGASGYAGDGGPASLAQLSNPSGVAVDAAGNVYIGDTGNNAVRLLVPVGARAVLSAASTHTGYFAPGQAAATFAVVVSNAAGAGPTVGTVTVKESVSNGLTLVSMAGAGWTCSNGACTRGDALSPGSSYPAVTVTVNIAADAPSQVTNQVVVSGGGSAASSSSDAAVVVAPPQAPVLMTPANGATGILGSPMLTWAAAFGAVSYDVYFGASSAPSLVGSTAATSFALGSLMPSSTYYWRVVANGPTGSASSATGSFATAAVAGLRFVPVPPCRVVDTRGVDAPFGGPSMGSGMMRSFAIPDSGCGIPHTAQAFSLNLTAVPQGPLGYLTLWPTGQVKPLVSTLNSWDGQVVANAAIVPAGTDGAVSVFVSGVADVVIDINGYFDTSTGASSFAFYTATPCRVADTRNPNGDFGGPSMSAGQSRGFPIPASSCGIPSGAGAYSLNVTAVPSGYLGYLTTWPTGQTQPNASTLNSWTGKVVANAALVPAGTGGSVSVFVSDPTDVILDTNGYFAAPGTTGALTFYPVTPCRVADTRGATGEFGGPTMEAYATRTFTIPASSCSIPATAAAYALNVTVVPSGVLAYLTTWPTGSGQPFVSTLNSFDGSVVANAAIVPAGTGGAINVYVTNRTDVILDINGYFAP